MNLIWQRYQLNTVTSLLWLNANLDGQLNSELSKLSINYVNKVISTCFLSLEEFMPASQLCRANKSWFSLWYHWWWWCLALTTVTPPYLDFQHQKCHSGFRTLRSSVVLGFDRWSHITLCYNNSAGYQSNIELCFKVATLMYSIFHQRCLPYVLRRVITVWPSTTSSVVCRIRTHREKETCILCLQSRPAVWNGLPPTLRLINSRALKSDFKRLF